MHADWEAKHGPVSGPFNAAGATLAAAWAGHAAHMPPAWAVATATAGLVGHTIAGVRHRIIGMSLAMRAATWAGAGAWCSWAMATTPWSTNTLGTLAAGTIGLAVAWTGEQRAERKAALARQDQQTAELTEAAQALRSKLAADWTNRFARVCSAEGVTVTGIEQWDTGAGYTLEIVPPGGTTWRQLKPYEDRLAGDARLPEGCGVEITPGADRGAALVAVATVNRLIDDVEYPADFSPTSINDFSTIGVHKDGAQAGAVMRQLTALTVGQKGSGKTNLMNVKLANQVRMVDNLIWVIDLNGGGLALPWLHAWNKAGRPGRPPVDWVADTPEKALAMAEALLRIAKARKPGYKALEIAANDDKLPVSAKIPAITLDCDEIAELYSMKARQDPVLKKTGDTLIQVVELARAVACNVENAALRATQDVISQPQILQQSALKVGMAVATESELNYLFGWADRLSPEDAPYPGCGFIKVGSQPARPFKAYRITPQIIEKAVLATTGIRPELDALSRKVAGEAYERRWEDTDHLFFSDPGNFEDLLEQTAASESEPDLGLPKPIRRSVTADWDTTAPASSVEDAIAAADAIRDRTRNAANEATTHDDDLERQFRAILDGGGALWKPPVDLQPEPAQPTDDVPSPTPGVSDDARWPMVFSIVAKAGPSGIGPDAIRDIFRVALPGAQVPSRSAITDWLKAEPRIHKPAHGMYAHVQYRTDTPGDPQ
jgi:hypothetical protein